MGGVKLGLIWDDDDDDWLIIMVAVCMRETCGGLFRCRRMHCDGGGDSGGARKV